MSYKTPAHRLTLPKRYERLRDEAHDSNADLTRIVRRISDATDRVEFVLRQMRDGGLGRFELFLGNSGSGKTTFFSTLPRFYTSATVTPIEDTVSLVEIPNTIQALREHSIENQIFILVERDNPEVPVQDLRTMFESLRRLFRTKEGKVALFWPITDEEATSTISEVAWQIGRDSIVDVSTKGVYHFKGLPKQDYYDVADITTRFLNGGQGLETFGLVRDISDPLIQNSETISEFYSRLEAKSNEINDYYGDLLKERTIPSVWILLAGDDTKELGLTTATLTQGVEKKVDIDRLIAYLDNPDLDAAYLKEWKKRRHAVAYLMQRLDVRLFELPPNVALASARAFADQTVKDRLKRSHERPTEAIRSLKNTRFFQAIASLPSTSISKLRPANPEAVNEYKRIQATAASNDKPLNKALAEAIKAALADEGVAATVTAEKRTIDAKSNLQPDILVTLADGRIICLESTWRTTGSPVPNEIPKQQNTMTVGHIQQYLLAKVLEYVQDLDL